MLAQLNAQEYTYQLAALLSVHMIMSNLRFIEPSMLCIIEGIALIPSLLALNLSKLTACHCYYMPLN